MVAAGASAMTAEPAPCAELPTIDVKQLASAVDAEDPAVKSLHQACIDTGFFILANHDVSSDVMTAAFAAHSRFFALGKDDKTARAGHSVAKFKGFMPTDTGVECLSYGAPVHDVFGRSVASEEALVFDTPLAELHAAFVDLSRVLLGGLSLALHQPRDFFEEAGFREPVANLACNYYPRTSDNTVYLEVAGHTDTSFFTFVCSEGGHGLQLQRLDGTWVGIPNTRHSFVVNIGDLAERWTNGVYKSTVHRIVRADDDERHSIAFFNNMDSAAVLTPVPSCVSAERPSKHAVITAGQYWEWRMSGQWEPAGDGTTKFEMGKDAVLEQGDVVEADLPSGL
jgi:isopenicillin N synthase-like dioxygenase